MINELVGRVFAARDIAHKEHWRTNSYAQHMALGSFYDALPGLIDSIVETYQGLNGLVEPEIVTSEMPDAFAEWLREEATWIESNREMISVGSDAIAALIDDLTAEYLQTIYKLENLA